ncbi:MAG: hypothetical protein ACKOJ9_10820 [Actinomycetota bacterium]
MATITTVVGMASPTSATVASVPPSSCNEGIAVLARGAGATPIDLASGLAGPLYDTDGERVEGGAFSPDGRRLYLTLADNTLAEFDVATAERLRTAALPAKGRDIEVSPDGRTLYISTPSESFGVLFVDEATLTVTSNLVLSAYGHDLNPGQMALDPARNRLYTLGSWGGTSWQVFAIDTAARSVVAHTGGGTSQRAIAVTSDGRYVVLDHRFTYMQSQIRIIDTTTFSRVLTLDMGIEQNLPQIVTTDDPTLVYVADATTGLVNVINVETGVIIRTLPSVGIGFDGLAVTLDGSKVITSRSNFDSSDVEWQISDGASGTEIAHGLSGGDVGWLTEWANIILCPHSTPALPVTGTRSRGIFGGGFLLTVLGILTIAARRLHSNSISS